MDAREARRRLHEVRARIAELEESIPAHSTSVQHVMEIEALEDEAEELERFLAK